MTTRQYSSRQIEQIVNDLLNERGIVRPQVSPTAIARSLDVPVIEQPMSSDVSGALIALDGSYGITVNSTQAPVRKRYTVAHELGHKILGHKSGDHVDWGFMVLRRDSRSSEAIDNQEIEANSFAACLLMPRKMLRSDVEELQDYYGEVHLSSENVSGLAKQYGVSTTAMSYRLMNLGLMSYVE